MSLDAMPVPLARGRGFAWVDPQDHEAVSQHPWGLQVIRSSRTDYAQSTIRNADGSRRTVTLHKFIAKRMGILDGKLVDHRDRCGLNCTRANLRDSNYVSNSLNRAADRTSTSRFKGVHWSAYSYNAGPGRGMWRSNICTGNRDIHLGCFPSEESAARVYDAWAHDAFGEFAYLNFPGDWR